MSISLHVGTRAYEVGSPGFFGAFFSTVYVRLEDRSWGSRFPVVMTNLYAGRLPPELAAAALAELAAIRTALRCFPPQAVVWDHENPQALPPWGATISPGISSLASYFVTSDGKDLLDTISNAVQEATTARRPVLVQ